MVILAKLVGFVDTDLDDFGQVSYHYSVGVLFFVHELCCQCRLYRN